jgi:hypothetical protein
MYFLLLQEQPLIVEAGLHAVGAEKLHLNMKILGIGIDEHPYLAMATDMILDPTNLLVQELFLN